MGGDFMLKINPIQLFGIWKEGYALDYHSITSEFMGTDEWGRDRFHTIRSDLGELLYQFKYNQDRSKLDQIMRFVKPFISHWQAIKEIDVILPVPPSNNNREFQPVFELSKKIADYLEIPTYNDVLEKKSASQAKNLSKTDKREISGSIVRKKRFLKVVNVLVIDDLYATGTTLHETVKALKTDANVKDVYVLTITKTRR
jgi:competence protein ComFC